MYVLPTARRISVALLFAFTVGAVVCAFTVFNILVAGQWYMNFSDRICESVITDKLSSHFLEAVVGGMTTVVLIIAFSAFMML